MTKLFENPPAEITHTSHPHSLKLTNDGAPFKCDGCNEPGDGPRYTCGCGRRRFDLHTRCALAESLEKTTDHPLFRGHTFEFRRQPPHPVEETICDACGEPAHGFVYHCPGRRGGGGLDLHPCCASLPPRILKDGRALVLHASTSRRCGVCGRHGRRGDFWAYRFEGEDGVDDLHVACIKEAALDVWKMAYENENHSGGAQNLHVGLTDIEGLLQICRNNQTSSGLDQFIRIAGSVASIVIAIAFGNPAALISAIPKKY